jgi:tRNA threonylcarbamoyl adenosine modification protein YeaZ
MAVLALDTATSCMSVALLKEGTAVCEINLTVKAGHGGILLPVIDEALGKSGISREEINLIAVGTGPGSFTGLRIGIATAKGLAMALDRPIAGISTLDALARGALPAPMQIMPVLDAKKHEVFCALYDRDGNRLLEPMNLRPEGIRDLVTKETLFIGNALPLYRDIFKETMRSRFQEGPANLWYPRATVIGLMALEMPEDSHTLDVLPTYVRASDATILLGKTRK